MKLLYTEEHLSCFHYSKEKTSLIEFLDKEKNTIFDYMSKQNCIFFILRGEITYSSGTLSNIKIKAGKFFTAPGNKKSTIQVDENAMIMVMKLNINLSFCDHLPLDRLYDKDLKGKDKEISFLKVNPISKTFLTSLQGYFNDGLRCTYFLELKVREFMYILRAYYPKKELQLFFQPILNKDMEFSTLAYKNLKNVKTVKELATLMNYSLSGFEKRFKKVFGISASKWMEEHKAKEIYHEINCSHKTIMEIGYDFGYSPSHFNDYCKRLFKKTPNKLRETQDQYLAKK